MWGTQQSKQESQQTISMRQCTTSLSKTEDILLPTTITNSQNHFALLSMKLFVMEFLMIGLFKTEIQSTWMLLSTKTEFTQTSMKPILQEKQRNQASFQSLKLMSVFLKPQKYASQAQCTEKLAMLYQNTLKKMGNLKTIQIVSEQDLLRAWHWLTFPLCTQCSSLFWK